MKAVDIFLDSLPFGLALALVVYLAHYLTTSTIMFVFKKLYFASAAGADAFLIGSTYMVGIGSLILAIPFSIILFLICRAKKLKPRLTLTLVYSSIFLTSLDAFNIFIMELFPGAIFLFFGISVALVFFGSLAIAILTAEKWAAFTGPKPEDSQKEGFKQWTKEKQGSLS